MQDFRTPTKVLGTRDDNRLQPANAKRKEKPSALCRTPPIIIKNKAGQSFQRGLCIGEGGFARCFQVNSGDGTLYAAKTIAKVTLKSEKTRAKLLAEIKIHRGMRHANVVQYVDCFEDDVNVYILLEMCSNQSLMEMVRRRKRLTEVEARFFLVQIMGAINYMHNRLVVHRDMKLGNVFIDHNMNLKIGDFGLAARLENPHQRRRTVCGTPNYIAPEVLMKPHEHTYPTDIWAAGIILYAMLFGKPPFQEKDVNVIYQRIKYHDLVFPKDHSVSKEAVDLISRMLGANPAQRPSVAQVLAHPWFQGQFVSSVPPQALKSEPVFNVSHEDSQLNFMTVKLACGLALNHSDTPAPIEPVTDADVHTGPKKVLPESLSPPSTRDKYQMVIVKDEAATVRPTPNYDSPIVERVSRRKQAIRDQEWPTAVRTSTEHPGLVNNSPAKLRAQGTDIASKRVSSAAAAAHHAMKHTPNSPNGGLEQNTNRYSGVARTLRTTSVSRKPSTTRKSAIAITGQSTRLISAQSTVLNSLRQTTDRIVDVVVAYNGKTLRAGDKTNLQKPLYLTKWADFNDVWGLAYGLNDGCVGMRFCDYTSMRMDPTHNTFCYYIPASNNQTSVRKLGVRPGNMDQSKKIEVLEFANKYMEERLGHCGGSRHATDSSDGIFVERFKRNKGYIMFAFSNGTVQFNFQDHNKIIMFGDGQYVHLVSAAKQEYTFTLAEAVLAADSLPEMNIKRKLEEMVMALTAEVK